MKHSKMSRQFNGVFACIKKKKAQFALFRIRGTGPLNLPVARSLEGSIYSLLRIAEQAIP
jgi:hypothetical protein